MGLRRACVLAVAVAACAGPPSQPARVSAPAVASTQPVAPQPQFPADWPYPAGPPTATSSRGMVVTDAALATHVGADVLARGGNAVDAAVAAAFALSVVFPTAGNVGGGGFLLARIDGKARALDFRETAPASATRDMYLGADGKATHDSREGPRSAGVPGTVAGLWEAWHSLGAKTLTWAQLLAPAIALAEHGFVVDAAFDKTISLVQTRLTKNPASAALFLPGGAPPPVGSTWRNADFAAVLRRLANEGPAGFYQGKVADSIAQAMKESGGLITAADLKGYRAKWRAPMEYDYRGRHVLGMPPPSSGGLTMAMIAHILEAWDLRALGWHSPRELHLTVEAMRRAFAARNAKLGDPDFVDNPVAELMSDDWAKKQRATIQVDRATPTAELFPSLTHDAEGPHTTHLSVVDAAGNAVALTTTLNAWFGSGVTVPGQGFLLNDEMDDFASVPGTANGFGLVQGEPNAIAPGKRMLSSMSPTIVLGEKGDVDLVLGAAGGSRIITATFQELSNAVDFGMDIEAAVRAPRIHQQDSPDVILFEPHALPDAVRDAIEHMGHATKQVEHLADAPALGRRGDVWQGAAEPRRDGSLALGPP